MKLLKTQGLGGISQVSFNLQEGGGFHWENTASETVLSLICCSYIQVPFSASVLENGTD